MSSKVIVKNVDSFMVNQSGDLRSDSSATKTGDSSVTPLGMFAQKNLGQFAEFLKLFRGEVGTSLIDEREEYKQDPADSARRSRDRLSFR